MKIFQLKKKNKPPMKMACCILIKNFEYTAWYYTLYKCRKL